MENTKDKLKEVVEDVKTDVEEVKEDITEKVADIKDDVEDKAADVKEDAGDKAADVKEFISDVVDGTAKTLSKFGSKVGEIFNDIKDSGKVQEAAKNIKDKTVDIAQATGEKFKEVVESDAVQDGLNKVKEVANNTKESIQNNEDIQKVFSKVGEVTEKSVNVVKEKVTDFVNDPNVKEGFNKAKDATVSTAQKAVDAVKDVFDKDKDDTKKE